MNQLVSTLARSSIFAATSMFSSASVLSTALNAAADSLLLRVFERSTEPCQSDVTALASSSARVASTAW